jgi:hypothetical protein
MRDLVSVHTRDGSRAALRGDPLSSCPWKPGTVGAVAWCSGWHAGRLMRPVARPLAFLATLAAVLLPWRRR